jgi:hypothetical protein
VNTAVQLILLLFGLVNAGVQLPGALTPHVVVGRRARQAPAGNSRGGRRGGRGGLHLPRRIDWREIVVIAVASSTGFTFALFLPPGFVDRSGASQLTVGALATWPALLALGAGRLLRVGRFAS